MDRDRAHRFFIISSGKYLNKYVDRFYIAGKLKVVVKALTFLEIL